MDLKLELVLGFRQEQEQHLTLTVEERDALSKLLRMVDQKTPMGIEFKLDVLQTIISPAKPGISALAVDREIARVPQEETLSVFFYALTPEELKMIDSGEMVGGYMGDIIYVSTAVDPEFVPYVILNLEVLRRASKEEAKAFLNRLGIDPGQISPDTGRHWTANLFDLALAERTMDPSIFLRFLEWRKTVERTDFFRCAEIDAVTRAADREKTRRRTRHPLKRGM